MHKAYHKMLRITVIMRALVDIAKKYLYIFGC